MRLIRLVAVAALTAFIAVAVPASAMAGEGGHPAGCPATKLPKIIEPVVGAVVVVCVDTDINTTDLPRLPLDVPLPGLPGLPALPDLATLL